MSPAPPKLTLLGPPAVARTTASSPTLFWHLDSPASPDSRLRFSLLQKAGGMARVERLLAAPARAGLQRLRLRELGIELEPNAEYDWSIALRGSRGIEGRGPEAAQAPRRIQRIVPTESASPPEADSEYWYDTLEKLMDAIDAVPSSDRRRMAESELQTLRRARDDLLCEAGLCGFLESAAAPAPP